LTLVFYQIWFLYIPGVPQATILSATLTQMHVHVVAPISNLNYFWWRLINRDTRVNMATMDRNFKPAISPIPLQICFRECR